VNPFWIFGGLLAAWALTVTALGVMRKDFPGNESGARAVMGITVVLVAAAMGTAIWAGATDHDKKGVRHGPEPAGGHKAE
jgi:hypothetical protein